MENWNNEKTSGILLKVPAISDEVNDIVTIRKQLTSLIMH